MRLTTYQRRKAAADKLADLRAKDYGMDDPEIGWLREEMTRLDMELLKDEVERLKREKGYKFDGASTPDQLGCDAWILAN